MRNLWLTVLFVVTAAAATYVAVFTAARDRGLEQALREPNAGAWMRSEFGLSDTQFAAVQRVQEDYLKVCSEHCERILQARARGEDASVIARLESDCVTSMTAHFRQVADLLPAGQGERYLTLVLPRIADYDHASAPQLDARK